MLDFYHFFQGEPPPSSTITGVYNWNLVILSYAIASLASFVALDLTERIRTSGQTTKALFGWLILGAVAMGMGIWTMHFIGMLAFIMPMAMDYEPILTALSLIIAIMSSAFAFFLIKNKVVKPFQFIVGGIALGLAIVSMHYVGMAAMLDVKIHYIPSLFFLSIAIAIIASEAALWLMIKSDDAQMQRYHTLFKTGSALIMGLAICGMHYTGMAAAIFEEDTGSMAQHLRHDSLNVDNLSAYIAAMTILIMLIALAASRFWTHVLQVRNKKLIEAEAILEEKSRELQRLNEQLSDLAEEAMKKEERISAILTAAADGILVINGEGIIEVCNRAASEMFEYPIDEILSKSIAQFVGYPVIDNADQQLKDEFHPISLSSLTEKMDALLEFSGRLKGNKLFPLELNISRSKIKTSPVYIIVCRDITARKQAEQELISLNNQLLTTARLAGMAEVATGVLHNVGNVLTSISVSAQLLLERDINPKTQGVKEFSKILKTQQKDEIENYLQTHELGKMLPRYLEELANYLTREMNSIHEELAFLNAKVLHVKSIIAMQQSIQKSSSIIEKIQLPKLLSDALAINSEMIEKNQIIVEQNFDKLPPIEIDKVKIMQIFINLIKNSIESLIESNKSKKKITLDEPIPIMQFF